ncbi:MAG TPA: DUF692 family protein [Solirubrobacteraceae bacterium]|jgi:hypothetical protein
MSASAEPGVRTGIGTTFEGHDARGLARVLPLVDYVEVTPDAIARRDTGRARIDRRKLALLHAVASETTVVVHGVGLSIGSHDGWSDEYLGLLDEIVGAVEVAWHSEHLAYTRVDGRFLGTMLALPPTEEALDLVAERVTAIRERYPLPFLLENIVQLVPEAPGAYSDAGFLNALCGRTGCGVLLDVYNLECDAHNRGFDIPAFLDELDLSHVGELHVACGVEERGLMLDVHSRVPRASTLDLAAEVVARAPNVRGVTYELLPEAVPTLGDDVVAGELVRLRERLAAA